jgi:hypothetical protein
MLHIPPPTLPQGTPIELEAAIEKAARDALARHGLSAFTMTREAALAREASHAIVAAHEGFTVRCGSVRQGSPTSHLGLAHVGQRERDAFYAKSANCAESPIVQRIWPDQ